MDAVSLPVFMRVSSQMAPISFAKTQVPSLYGQFHFSCLSLEPGSLLLCARLFHCPLDGAAQHQRRLRVCKKEFPALAPHRQHTDILGAVEERGAVGEVSYQHLSFRPAAFLALEGQALVSALKVG